MLDNFLSNKPKFCHIPGLCDKRFGMECTAVEQMLGDVMKSQSASSFFGDVTFLWVCLAVMN